MLGQLGATLDGRRRSRSPRIASGSRGSRPRQEAERRPHWLAGAQCAVGRRPRRPRRSGRPRSERPGRGDRGVLLAQRSRRGVPRVGEQAGARLELRARSAPRTPRAAGRPRRGPRRPRERTGGRVEPVRDVARSVATFAVTSSPTTPSPRVAAWTSAPRVAERHRERRRSSARTRRPTASRSTSGSCAAKALGPRARARRRRTRCRGSSSGRGARTSAKSVASGARRRAGSASPAWRARGAPPRVGGARATSASYSASAISGVVEHGSSASLW